MMNSNGIEGMRKCVICVSGFSSESSPTREQVKNMIDMIGACYMGPLCRNYTTHLVCLNRDRWSWREKVTSSDKCVAAREWGPTIRIVRVEWLMACIREWRFVDEGEFGGSVVNEDEVETGDDEVEGDVGGVEGDVAEVEGDVAEVEGDAEERKDNEMEGNALEMEGNAEEGIHESGDKEKDNKPTLNEREEERLVWEKLFDNGELDLKCLSPTLLTRRRYRESDDELPSKHIENTPTHVFLLSSDAFTTDITHTIEQLGGVVINSNRFYFPLHITRSSFDPRATHYITASLKRTEKHLGAVACGLWVLKPEYVEKCRNEGRWVDEEEFEWRESDREGKIDGASIRFWREQKKKAFEGAKCALLL